ncbi:hypothetical protein C8Q78DRAFT_1016789 [Trametes maxima]|nr:hypothetical protein C8Q78DRAFT_1016789 [Trametes maxima]
MHLIWENLIPNLISLWTGGFKKLNQGRHTYELPGTVWDAIGEATARSGDTIPTIFGPRMGNIAKDRSAATADAWSLWTLYLAPVLLRQRFAHVRYYEHFVDLVQLLLLCLQFEISAADLEQIRRGFVRWVKKYEEYYYQYTPSRLPTCPVTVHALLHIADEIKAAGPVWAYWAFPMERFCGRLQPAIKNRRYPWASIDRRILELARLSQIKLVYNLHEELSLKPPIPPEDVCRRGEVAFPEYPTCILGTPRHIFVPDKGLCDKIIGCLVTRLERRPEIIHKHLPHSIEQFGRVRILGAGDIIDAAALVRRAGDRRDRTYVRYEVFVDRFAQHRRRLPEYELQTFYGRLERLIVVPFSDPSAIAALGFDGPTTIVLAAIRPCAITSTSSKLDIHYYSQYGALSLIDIQCIQCVVGRVPDGPSGRSWGLVDRSGALARALAVDE